MEGFNKQDALRIIPPVNEILECPEVLVLVERFGRELILDITRQVICEYRENIDMDEQFSEKYNLQVRQGVTKHIIKRLNEKLEGHSKIGLRKVLNATGIVLHTNLGRAPLPEKALKSMQDVGEGYSNLEYDLEIGTRGSRHSHVELLLNRITGAESAIVVNNNAAAVFLCINTLAAGKEVVVSRGQQVEIGGSFRIPDIISRSGAKMVEVGTTNKTRISDYATATGEETSILLKVHTSNYKVTGFTEEVSLRELAALGKEKGIAVMEDLGSGCLYDITNMGLSYEPLVQDSVNDGADLVTFSGDKLLGGPQAGIIAGKKELIERIRENPLSRMLRCDKTTIAALAAVLNLYTDTDTVVDSIPVLRMMAMKEEELLRNAMELQKSINDSLRNKCKVEVIEDYDEVGGGSLPGVVLKGKAVALTASGMEANELQARLRGEKYPVVCRINKDRVLLNVRTLERRDYPVIVESLVRILG